MTTLSGSPASAFTDPPKNRAGTRIASHARSMKYLSRARYLVLILPAFALFSTAQVGCTTNTSSGDSYAKEDPKNGPGGGTDYGSYDDGYDTYGYD